MPLESPAARVSALAWHAACLTRSVELETNRSQRRSPDDPATALTLVVDNLTSLVQAELQLARAQARSSLRELGTAASLMFLSALLVQVFVLLLALSPLLLAGRGWLGVGLMLLIPLLCALLAAGFGWRLLRRRSTPGEAHDHGHE